jgi:hypothetical protein
MEENTMSVELLKAMRGAAKRRLDTEPRDPVSHGQRFEAQPRAPRLLIAVVVLSALLLIGLIISYLADIPPAHILITALGLFWLFGWRIFRVFKRSKV